MAENGGGDDCREVRAALVVALDALRLAMWWWRVGTGTGRDRRGPEESEAMEVVEDAYVAATVTRIVDDRRRVEG